MKIKNYVTWAEIRRMSNALTDTQLNNTVTVQSSDGGLSLITGIGGTTEDVYANKEDLYDCGTIEDLAKLHGEKFDPESYQIITPKGTPFLTHE